MTELDDFPFLSSALFLSGLIGVFFWRRIAHQTLAARSWSIAPGRVVAATVVKSTGGESGPTFETVVRYRFVVDGVERNGDRVGFGLANMALGEIEARALLGRYRVGAQVVVYYDPATMASVLDINEQPAVRRFGLVTGAFALAGLLGIAAHYVSLP